MPLRSWLGSTVSATAAPLVGATGIQRLSPPNSQTDGPRASFPRRCAKGWNRAWVTWLTKAAPPVSAAVKARLRRSGLGGPPGADSAQDRFVFFFFYLFFTFSISKFKFEFKPIWLNTKTYICEIRGINSGYIYLYIIYIFKIFLPFFLFSPFFLIFKPNFNFRVLIQLLELLYYYYPYYFFL
jgi:hypothetical protein